MLSCFSGSHKELSDKFREILTNILRLGEDELVEGLKEKKIRSNVKLLKLQKDLMQGFDKLKLFSD